jgi:hypothetical protein
MRQGLLGTCAEHLPDSLRIVRRDAAILETLHKRRQRIG